MRFIFLAAIFIVSQGAFSQYENTGDTQYRSNEKCRERVKEAFKKNKFGGPDAKREDKHFDDVDLTVLCRGNEADKAIDCVTELYKRRKLDAIQLAELCSGGVSGKYAADCLGDAEAKLGSGALMQAIHACNGLARKVACNLLKPEGICVGSKEVSREAVH